MESAIGLRGAIPVWMVPRVSTHRTNPATVPTEPSVLIQSEQDLEQIFRQYYLRLKSYAQSLISDPDQAEELVQEVFVNLWEKRAQVQVSTSIKSYLFRAVHNRALNVYRKRSTQAAYVAAQQSDPPPVSDHDPAEQAELAARIQAAIGMLPDRCGQVFRLSRFEGLSYKEIAQRLQISPKTVEVQMGKALRILRQALKDYLPAWMLYLLFDQL